MAKIAEGERVTLQTLTISGWHPRTNPNGSNSKGHWSEIRRRHDSDRDMAWAKAREAGWVFVPGKVKLTITLVYPRNTLPDSDNAYARCKGLIDGLKNHARTEWVGDGDLAHVISTGFFCDDDTEHLDLEVRAIVEKGVKAVRIELQPVEVVA